MGFDTDATATAVASQSIVENMSAMSLLRIFYWLCQQPVPECWCRYGRHHTNVL